MFRHLARETMLSSRRSKMWLRSLTLVAALAGPTTQAVAAPKRVAVLGVAIGGDGAPELQIPLAESVAAGISGSGATAISLASARAAFREAPELVGCVSSTCLARLGERLGADGFIRGEVLAEGADYRVKLELFSQAEVIQRIEKSCPVCTIGELTTLAEATAKLLVERASDSPIQVVIRTEPAGAELTIDGLSQGAAPFEGPLAPGPHLVVVRTSGGAVVRHRIEVDRATGAEPVVIRVPEAARTEPRPARGHVGFGRWKWGVAAVGAVALGGGVALIVIDGNRTCADASRPCPRVRDTRPAGIVSVGFGAALAAASAYMIWSDSKSSPVPIVEASRGGASVGIHGTF